MASLVPLSFSIKRNEGDIDKERVLLIILVLCLAIWNIPRLFHNVFWADECFSLLTAQGLDQYIDNTLNDAGAHPPLYNFMLWVFCNIFGYNPVTYQILSFIPWIIIVLLGVTVIKEKFGVVTSFSFILFCTFLDTSRVYITEVRSYEWDALLILLCYLFCYKIFCDHKPRDYYLFAIFSIISAYLHYYCIFAVFFFYMILLIEAIVHKKEMLRKILSLIIVSLICYLPWIVIAFQAIRDLTENFWQTSVPPFYDCMGWIFKFEFGNDYVSTIVGIILFSIMVLCSVIVIRHNCDGKISIEKLSGIDWWLIAGLTSIIGTIVLATVVSYLIHPMLVHRYLYPVSIVAWLLFTYTVVKCLEYRNELRKKVSIALICSLLVVGAPSFYVSMLEENQNNEETEATLDELNFITAEDIIYTDIHHFAWTLIDFYFSGAGKQEISLDDLPVVDKTKCNYLFISQKMNDQIEAQLSSQGLSYTIVTESAVIERHHFNVYLIAVL